MFNVGGPEILLVLLVALVVLGPEQLPKAMRTFGNAMAQVRKLSSGFQDEMRGAMNALDVTSSVGSASTSSSSSSSSAGSGSASNTSGGGTAAAGPAPAGGTTAAPVDPVSNRPGASSADRAAG